MTPDEVANLAAHRPDSEPPGFGRTILARVPAGLDAQAIMERIQGAWEVIARWGRWCDEELGEWLPTEEGLGQLPEWLQEAFKHEPSFEAENWMNTLHDREWVWWSGAVLDGLLKIDLDLEAMPVSTWPVEFVLEKAGATVVYRNGWLSPGEVVDRFGPKAV